MNLYLGDKRVGKIIMVDELGNENKYTPFLIINTSEDENLLASEEEKLG